MCLVGHDYLHDEVAHEREVSTAEAQAFADRNKLAYIEVSAKSSLNIEKMFIDITTRILDAIDAADPHSIALRQEVKKCKIILLLALHQRTGCGF